MVASSQDALLSNVRAYWLWPPTPTPAECFSLLLFPVPTSHEASLISCELSHSLLSAKFVRARFCESRFCRTQLLSAPTLFQIQWEIIKTKFGHLIIILCSCSISQLHSNSGVDHIFRFIGCPAFLLSQHLLRSSLHKRLCEGEGKCLPSLAGPQCSGSTLSCEATAATKWHFCHWQIAGASVPRNRVCFCWLRRLLQAKASGLSEMWHSVSP